jgi:hypothetical protein
LKLEHENWPRGKPSEGLGSNLKGGGRLSGRVVEQTAKKVLVDCPRSSESAGFWTAAG